MELAIAAGVCVVSVFGAWFACRRVRCQAELDQVRSLVRLRRHLQDMVGARWMSQKVADALFEQCLGHELPAIAASVRATSFAFSGRGRDRKALNRLARAAAGLDPVDHARFSAALSSPAPVLPSFLPPVPAPQPPPDPVGWLPPLAATATPAPPPPAAG